MANTRKKVKVIGSETYINQQTGMLQEMQVVNIEERDANFHKIWLYHIADALDLIGNQKTRVLYHIMENLNSENQYIGTQRTIAEKLGMSSQTVTLTIKKLKEANFLKSSSIGVYQVNPDIIFKGGKNKRFSVLLEYTSMDSDSEEAIFTEDEKKTTKYKIIRQKNSQARKKALV